MTNTLRALRELAPGTPVLADGLVVQLEHTIQFPTPAHATFYARAWREVPVLLDRLEALEAKLRSLDADSARELEAWIAQQRADLDAAHARARELEAQLEQAHAARAAAEGKARNLARAILRLATSKKSS